MSSGKDTEKEPSAPAKIKVEPDERDMGKALRSVYQRAIEEAVPDEMLDLLGKLN